MMRSRFWLSRLASSSAWRNVTGSDHAFIIAADAHDGVRTDGFASAPVARLGQYPSATTSPQLCVDDVLFILTLRRERGVMFHKTRGVQLRGPTVAVQSAPAGRRRLKSLSRLAPKPGHLIVLGSQPGQREWRQPTCPARPFHEHSLMTLSDRTESFRALLKYPLK